MQTPETCSLELSIVMPCLNEEETLASCIEAANSYLSRSGVSGEIVIGDNGSTDRSVEIATALGARVVHIQRKGYGSACHGAALEALGKYIIMGDSDCSYDFSQLDGFVKELRDGADLVMGNRFQGGIKKGAMPFKNRYLGNPILSFIGKILFKTKIGDFHCGLRGFSKTALETMQLHSPGMEFASEMVMKASLLELDVREVPTVLSQDGRSRPPHLRPWRDGWRHLRLMFLYSPRYLFFVPGALLTALGLFLMLQILVIDSDKSFLVSGPASLVYALGMIVVGMQSVLLFIAARVYGGQQGLLPKTMRLKWFTKSESSDRLLIAGIVLAGLSVIGILISLYHWLKAGFGPLDTMEILSVVVPSTAAATIGFELILFSLFIGLMALRSEGD